MVEPAPQTPTIRILTSLAYYKTTTYHQRANIPENLSTKTQENCLS